MLMQIAHAKISPEGKQELEWWLENTDNIKRSIALPSIDLEYFCDLSSYSWVKHFDTHKIGGVWNIKEKILHINYQKLLVVYYSLRTFKTYSKITCQNIFR